MAKVFVLITLFFSFFVIENNNTNSITADEVANRYCNCGHNNKLEKYSSAYTQATSPEAKEVAKKDYLSALRATQQCVKVEEVQESVRKLPREEKSQFEKNVMKKLTETCSDIAIALQVLR